MRALFRDLSIFVAAILLASCAQPQKLAAPMAAAASGTTFDRVGKVGLYQGEPCTSQIMFVFRAGRSGPIPMAASMRVTRILTEAAQRNRSVHISGKWRRGKQAGCAYVEVTKVELQKSLWPLL